jgi:hypothetical protein
MSFAITRETKGAYVKWSGKIMGVDFLRAVHVVNISPDFEIYYYVINDAVGCGAIDLPALSIAKVANDYMRTAVFGNLAEARNWALTAPRN